MQKRQLVSQGGITMKSVLFLINVTSVMMLTILIIVHPCGWTQEATPESIVQMRTPTVKPYFEENLGQLSHKEVLYFAKGLHLEVGFADGRVLYHGQKWRSLTEDRLEQVRSILFGVKIGDGNVHPEPLELRPSRSHYFIGPDFNKWIKGVHHYGRILYRDVYPGIDLVYFFDEQGRLTYEFIVKPGADPSAIELSYAGIEGTEPCGVTAMDVITEFGKRRGKACVFWLRDGELSCYQDVDGERHVVNGNFQQTSVVSYGINLPESYDRSRSLVIDPAIVFSTYWGSIAGGNRSVALDSAGNIYTSGAAGPATWPAKIGVIDSTSKWPDVGLAKYDSKGNVMWATYVGGPIEDYAYVSAVNEEGELYVAGRAGDGFPTTPGAYNPKFNGGTNEGGRVHGPTDCFVLKLSATGDTLLYSTYIGGSGDENGRAIHLLPSGELLVGGGPTGTTDLPTTPGAFMPNKPGPKSAWLAKLSADGSKLLFCTYFGPTDGFAHLRGLGVDVHGNVWLAGTTGGTTLTTTPNAFQKVRGGGKSEVYIAKLSSDGKNLVYFSWLGGSQLDDVETEGVSDAQGNFYVAGATSSPDFLTIVWQNLGCYFNRCDNYLIAWYGFLFSAKDMPTGTLSVDFDHSRDKT